MRYYDFAFIDSKLDLDLTILNLKKENIFLTSKVSELRSNNSKKISFLDTNYEDTLKAAKKGSVDFINYSSILDKTLLKFMRETNTTLNITFSSVLRAKNKNEIIIDMKKVVKTSLKTKTPIILSSFAKNKKELVCADGLISFGEYLGLNKKESRRALNNVHEKILKRIR